MIGWTTADFQQLLTNSVGQSGVSFVIFFGKAHASKSMANWSSQLTHCSFTSTTWRVAAGLWGNPWNIKWRCRYRTVAGRLPAG